MKVFYPCPYCEANKEATDVTLRLHEKVGVCAPVEEEVVCSACNKLFKIRAEATVFFKVLKIGEIPECT